jgi:hypothetical protein
MTSNTRSSSSGIKEKIKLAVSQDMAARFDALGLISTGSSVTPVPAMAPTTGAKPNAADDRRSQPE